MDRAEYLGDGVYATYDGFAITLTTGHHLQEEAGMIIYLEPDVIKALLKFVKKYTEVKDDTQ